LADLLADSYAFLALIEGNDRYRAIFARGCFVTTAMNVVEVYTALMRRMEPAEARAFAKRMLSVVVEVPPETALSAAEFRRKMRESGKDCSHIDAWGWAAAKALGRKFLTGDQAFKGVENVEFVR
jgi:predicted nucleic acid-binding protein